MVHDINCKNQNASNLVLLMALQLSERGLVLCVCHVAIYQYMAHLWKMQMYLQKYSKPGRFEYICRCICIYSSWNVEGLTLHPTVPWFNPAHSAKDHIRVTRINCENILKEKLENKRFWLTLENNQTLNIPFFINRAWKIKTLLMP